MALKVAVVGAGMMGRIHAGAWSTLPDIALWAVVDANLNAGQTLANDYGAEAFISLDEVLKASDIISICSPPHVHCQQVITAAHAGVHILLEKPACLSLTELDAMIEAVNTSSVQLLMGMTQRFYPESRAAADYLTGGKAGQIVSLSEQMQLDPLDLPDWYFSRELAGGGVLLTNGIHSLDRILWLSGAAQASIKHASLHNLAKRGDVEDFAEVDLLLDNGISAHVKLLWQAGASGEARLDITCQQVQLSVTGWQSFEVFGQDSFKERYYQDDMDFLDRTLIGIKAEATELLEAVQNNKSPSSTLSQHRQAFALIQEIYSNYEVAA